jgi:transposase
MAPLLQLTAPERATLAARLRARTLRVEDVRRARVILMLADGQSYTTIQAAVGCDPRYVSRWRQRFVEAGLAGLYSRHRGRAVARRTPKLEARILALTQQPPPNGSTHWSTRRLAQHLGVSHMMVARVWQRARLQPHRLTHYVASDDEKTAIQALDRTDPVLPLSPGRAERHGFEYIRHGTLSLYAALNTKTGEVYGQTAARHTREAFVAFLAGLVAQQPRRQEIHILADNLSAHNTERVRQLLRDHPRVHLHYTPTYASWLNQVELWFAKIERDVIARGIFTSVPDLARNLLRYIRQANRTPKPIRWTYTNTEHRIRATGNSTVTGH